MPIIEFTHSEQHLYARELQLGAEHIRRAEAEAQLAMGKTLGAICESHNHVAPGPVDFIKDKHGKVIGIGWGREYKDFLDGATKIDGAVLPPGHTPRKAPKLDPAAAAALAASKKAETPAPPVGDPSATAIPTEKLAPVTPMPTNGA